MVWPSALHSIARPLQLSAAGGRQIGRGFAPGQQPLPLRKPRSSGNSSHYHYQAVVEVVLAAVTTRCRTTTTKHWAPAITSSCLYIDARYLSCSNRGPFATCYFFALFTTCYLFWFYSLHAMSLTYIISSLCILLYSPTAITW